jgi:hypothetical protein
MLNTSSLPTLTPSNFIKAYSGRPGCACGCRGTYYAAGDKMVARILKKIQAADPSTVDIGPTYVAVDSETRQWVLYTE